jgi:hypothetical protein
LGDQLPKRPGLVLISLAEDDASFASMDTILSVDWWTVRVLGVLCGHLAE